MRHPPVPNRPPHPASGVHPRYRSTPNRDGRRPSTRNGRCFSHRCAMCPASSPRRSQDSIRTRGAHSRLPLPPPWCRPSRIGIARGFARTRPAVPATEMDMPPRVAPHYRTAERGDRLKELSAFRRVQYPAVRPGGVGYLDGLRPVGWAADKSDRVLIHRDKRGDELISRNPRGAGFAVMRTGRRCAQWNFDRLLVINVT